MKKVALVGVLALSAALALVGCVTTETSDTVDGTSDTTIKDGVIHCTDGDLAVSSL